MRAGDVRLTVDPRQGGRMASLRIGEREVLVTEGWGPIRWGCYPMAPFAGRIRDGRFAFRGRDVQLPLNLPPDAIHGTVFERPWEVASATEDHVVLTTDLGPAWPYRGMVTQSIGLGAGWPRRDAGARGRGDDAGCARLAPMVPSLPRR